ncbi:epoxyqueuosine reductase QueH [uncultured Megasphaera sp.]
MLDLTSNFLGSHHVTVYYFNPNIHPEAEYRRRLKRWRN